LNKARDRARSASCLAREKQLSLHIFSLSKPPSVRDRK
jgi:hypothetical protein